MRSSRISMRDTFFLGLLRVFSRMFGLYMTDSYTRNPFRLMGMVFLTFFK